MYYHLFGNFNQQRNYFALNLSWFVFVRTKFDMYQCIVSEYDESKQPVENIFAFFTKKNYVYAAIWFHPGLVFTLTGFKKLLCMTLIVFWYDWSV